jgi:hypothetical protein
MLAAGKPVPGAPVPPEYVVGVLRRAAAAGGSSDELAVYNDLFPAVLREAANGSAQQLMEALGAIAAQVGGMTQQFLLFLCCYFVCMLP